MADTLAGRHGLSVVKPVVRVHKYEYDLALTRHRMLRVKIVITWVNPRK